MDLPTLIYSFSLVFLAELGDKTQLTVIVLSSLRKDLIYVFLGALIGLVLINFIGVLVGVVVLNFISSYLVKFVSGVSFIIIGLLIALRKPGFQRLDTRLSNVNTLASAFILTSLTELGDKTQISTIVLVAQYSDPISVFSGVTLAFTAITVIGVLLGDKLLKKIPINWVKKIAGVIFIISGLTWLLTLNLK